MDAREERDWHIGDLYARGGATRRQLAQKFNVSISTVNRALVGLNWKAIRADRQRNDDDDQRDREMWGGVGMWGL